jgi:hypothetical protein
MAVGELSSSPARWQSGLTMSSGRKA